MIRLLVFPGGAWLRLDGGTVAARGDRLTGVPAEAADEVIAIAAGAAVALHWLPLPPLAPAQATAAARMVAADLAAAPLDSLHIALGPADPDGVRLLAIADRAAVARWLGDLAAAGIDPDRLVPAPMLLPGTDDDTGACRFEAGDEWLVRGHRLAFAAEPELAALILGDRSCTRLAPGDFEAGLATALAAAPIDLRQGDFARPRRWRLDRRRIGRVAALAAALGTCLIAADIAALLRDDFAATRAEMQLADAARAALPRGTIVVDPRGQVAARLAALGGDGGFIGLALPLLQALETRPGAELAALRFAPDSGLVADVTGSGEDRAALAAAVTAAGLTARPGPDRDDAGRRHGDLVVTPR